MHDQPAIPDERLRVALRDDYDLSASSIAFLPLGLDSRAGVYRVEDVSGAAYLLKAKSSAIYEASCWAPRYLRDQGVAAVVAPRPNSHGGLWTSIGTWDHADWTLLLYPFIEGDVGWNPRMTDAQWKATGAALRQIHQIALPADGIPTLRDETFDPSEYGRWVRAFDADHAHETNARQSALAYQAHFRELRATIYKMLALMDDLAQALQSAAGSRVICHADLHPSNIIRDTTGQVWVIDWDDVMLAPKERDFLFVGNPPSDTASQSDGAPFFQGYGQTEIDWAALTYYRCERVMQDVVSFGEEICFRDDLGEESKMLSARIFGNIFTPGGMVDATWAAASHLPPALNLHAR